MTLSNKTKLSNYEITSQIGKGGMGEVYQAKDTKLGRDVAIKVLPEEFAKDADRVARFQREAKLLASLNHPNIAAIYGLEESDGTNFLVMELVEGNTLDDRIKSGRIPVEEALKLALQISEALEAAHEKGVIHRDLKPANIKVTPDEKVKVLDFGLAKAFAGEQADLNLSNSPTLSVAATQQGVILGTAAYMSPEQARGKEVDKRADIWAFGVVLFEMLSGKQVFTGDTVSDTLASVLAREPEWESLPHNLHLRIRLLLERCLKKDPKNRYHDIADARVDIQEVLDNPSGVLAQPVPSKESRTKFRTMIPWIALTAIICLIIAGIAGWILKSSPPPEPKQVVHFEYVLPEGQQFNDATNLPIVAISPDGSKFVYCTTKGLFIRSLNEFIPKHLTGTDGISRQPFFSPDGQWIGYWSENDRKLKKIPINGGPTTTLCDATSAGGFSWSSDNRILQGTEENIMWVPDIGGDWESLIYQEDGLLGAPQMLPGGEAIIYENGSIDPPMIMVQSLKSKKIKELLPGLFPRYIKTGHIIYGLENNLYAVPFDLEKLELTGKPFSIIEGVLISTFFSHYAVSESGTMVYVPSGQHSQSQLVWYDREGNPLESIGERANYYQFVLSPDEKRVVIEKSSSGSSPLWKLDLDRGGIGSPIIINGFNILSNPIWSPDGNSIAFRSQRAGNIAIFRKPLAGEEQTELLIDLDGNLIPEDWSEERRSVVFLNSYGSEERIYELPLGEKDPIKIMSGPYNYDGPKYSPSGKWLAYMSNESNRWEVYIKSLEEEIEEKVISTQGGVQPKWGGDDSALFYLALDGTMMTVELDGEQLTPSLPEPLFRTGLDVKPDPDQYAVTRDGRRFLLLIEEDLQNISSINIVLNWFEELKEKALVQ